MTVAHRPRNLDDALAALAEEGAVAVAGCTDLMVEDHARGRRHAVVVDLTRLSELRGIRETQDGLWIGAGTTFAELRRAPQVADAFPVVAEMASTIGALQIQSRATVGGNIANASPAGDSLPVWLALGATVELAGPGGRRSVPYDEVHVDYRRTALRRGELIVGLFVPPARPDEVFAFRKVGTRAAQAISKVVVAMRARRDGDALLDVRLAAGSVAPVPVRLREAERAAAGRAIDDAVAADVGAAAAGEVTPIDDVRSTADYRRFALARVVRRVVLRAVAGDAGAEASDR